MDCVPVYEAGKIFVREFRNVKKGDRVVLGRTENCEDGIYVHADCFEKEARGQAGALPSARAGAGKPDLVTIISN